MSCYLRCYGKEFDAIAYSKICPFGDFDFYSRGEPRFPKSNPNGRKNENSGVTIMASGAEQDDFEGQIGEAIRFLKEKREEIQALFKLPGVEERVLDFGIERRDVFGEFNYLPPELLILAGNLDLGIELSHYAAGPTEKGKNKAKKAEKKKNREKIKP